MMFISNKLNPKNNAVEKAIISSETIITLKKLPKSGKSIFSAITPISDDGSVIKMEKIKKGNTLGFMGDFL